MNLSKDELNLILGNKPAGVSDNDIINELKNRGYSFDEPKKPTLAKSIASGYEKGFKTTPGIKQVSKTVGFLTGKAGEAITGGVANIAETSRQLYRGAIGKGFNLGEITKKSYSIAKEGAQFGKQIGEEGGAGAFMSAAGKIPNLALTYSQIAEAKKSIESGDTLQGGIKLGLAMLGLKGALKTKGLILNKEYTTPLKKSVANSVPSLKPILFPVEHFGQKAAKALQENTLRLTPVQKQNMEKEVVRVVDFLTKSKIKGTPDARYAQVRTKYEAMEPKIQSFLDNDAKAMYANKNKIKAEINAIKDKYINDRDYLAIEKQLDDFMVLLDKNYKLQIPVNRLNALKRSTYKGAFNKAGNKVLDAVEFDIADILKKNIEYYTDKLPTKVDGMSIREFNQQYSTLLNAQKLLKVAKSRAELGLIGKAAGMTMGAGVGSVVGGPVGAGLGAVAGPQLGKFVAGTVPKTYLSALLETISRPTK